MSDIVVSIVDLSKSYQLGVIDTGTFYGDLNRWWARKRGKPDPYEKVGQVDHSNRDRETVWALKDINLEVPQGQALGIIGRNGAGKSTLLKILSQVTAPTSGEVKVKGRIASLLEVGTGFHPELTGRENIFMNGAILGMSRTEIKHKFDEIVDFSGVEKYIDTPVKRYSSGMTVRLAFAVAAHLEPEILVIDEVLAVGDAEFQKKCLGKMEDVAKGGRTVIFVSHNMGSIQALTKRCILLDSGHCVLDATPENTVSYYLESQADLLPDSQSGPYDTRIPEISIRNIAFDTRNLRPGFNQPLTFDFTLGVGAGSLDLTIKLVIVNNIEARIIISKADIPSLPTGDVVISMRLKNHYLPPGRYSINVNLKNRGVGIFSKPSVLVFEIPVTGIDDGFLAGYGNKSGIFLPNTYTIKERK
jgi:lipopolysaccharide transport system ATP-binding protein